MVKGGTPMAAATARLSSCTLSFSARSDKDRGLTLKKAGGFVPGIRPGEKTREYIDNVLTRLTFWGGIYISIISVLPMLLIAQFNVPFYFGGTSLLILVGVAIDFMGQVESHLISQQYGSLMGKANKG